jgi:hypothetical protein
LPHQQSAVRMAHQNQRWLDAGVGEQSVELVGDLVEGTRIRAEFTPSVAPWAEPGPIPPRNRRRRIPG